MSVVIIRVPAIQGSGRYWTCRVVTDKKKLAWECLDKGHTKDDLDTGVCVIENRVCMGDIRATRRRKCF